jgi:LCP family protein required for cell wall assembly
LRSQKQASHARTPSRAFVLSAVWPGLGQAYLGRRREAALFAIPPFAAFVPLVAASTRGTDGLIGYLVVPANAIVLTVAIAMSLAFRVASILSIIRSTGAKASMDHRSLLAALLVVVMATHAAAGYATIGLFGVTTRVFGLTVRDDPAGGAGSPTSSDPGVGTLPSAGPPLPVDERFTILLVGSDFGTGYTHSLTDTMMVVSVDPVAKTVVMASVPRDTARFEMYSGGVYEGKLNSLMSVAERDPGRYPEGGIGTLAHEIGFLVGIPIQYIAYINLGGFEKAIDAVGGVDVDVTQPIDDSFYQFPNGPKGFHLSAGLHHLDGPHAVAYVRSRYGPGDNDFTRARRQQQLLLALKDQMLRPSALPKFPRVLDELSRLVTTNYPPDQVGRLLELSHLIQSDGIQRFVLGPPYALRPPGGGEYVLVPDMDRLAKWSVKEFGAASRYAPH